MRLAYVIDSLGRSGGAEQALASMAPLWVASGTEVEVFSLGGEQDLRQPLEAGGVIVTANPASGRLATLHWLRDSFREAQPDLVHTTLFEADVLGRMAARMRGIPSISSLVATPYGADHYGQPGLLHRRVAMTHALDAATGRTVHRWHAVSRHVATTMSRRLLIPRRKIAVIPRGKERSVLGEWSQERRAVARSRLGIAVDVPLIVAAARHEPPKGLDLLLLAMAEVTTVLPRARAVVAGREGTVTGQLHELRAGLRLDDAIQFLGPRSDVADLLAAADVVCVPSVREGISNVAMEAMALGVPIVAADVPAVRETLGGDGNARLVARSPGAVSEAILSAIASGVGRREERAVAFFEREYRLEIVADRLRRLQESALLHGSS